MGTTTFQVVITTVVNYFPSLTVSDTVRDLGVIIDSRLTMADHVAAVCRSCYYQLMQLRSVARSLSSEAAKAVVHAFISCRLDYTAIPC